MGSGRFAHWDARMPRSAPRSSPTTPPITPPAPPARRAAVMIQPANVWRSCAPRSNAATWTLLPRADWLPLFPRLRHGVHGVLMAFAAGRHSDLMPAPSCARSPLSWWQTAARRGSTHSGAPHFAYVAVLGHWPNSPTGAPISPHCAACPAAPRPIRAGTVDRLVAALLATGRGPRCLRPATAWPKAVLGVNAPAPEPARAPPAHARSRALHGHARKTPKRPAQRRGLRRVLPGPARAHRRSADPARLQRPRASASSGWGESVGAGYWGRGEDSEAVFAARCRGDGPGCAPVTSPSGTRQTASPAA